MGRIRRHPVVAASLGMILVLVGTLVVTAFAVWRAAHNDEARRRDTVEVIAVLGAAQYGGDPSPTFQGRLRHAAILYRQGFAPTVLVLGGKRPGDLTTEAEAGRAWLISQGLPEDAVLAEPEGTTTKESLEAAASFMHDRGMTSVMLVSDPWHNLRIRRMARDLGLEAYVSATWHSAATSRWTRFSGYTRETLAYMYYRVVGA
jgi:uncharacterized SAM-binding protein YcdF (DUF218 family)